MIKGLWRIFILGRLMKRVENIVGRYGIYDGYFKLAFSLEYSDIIDWVVDFTPRRNHPKARQYGKFITSQDFDLVSALREALLKLEKSKLGEKYEVYNG